MTEALTVVPDVRMGTVLLTARDVPDGQITITRTRSRLVDEIRGGTFHADTGGFIRKDSEPPFGTELVYTVTDEVDNRAVQTNRILNPKANDNLNNWATGINRA